MSMIFNGVMRLGEVIVVVLCYLQDWEVKHFLQKNLNAEELTN
jgi:hypothetical protein